jgi:hypothetical protein
MRAVLVSVIFSVSTVLSACSSNAPPADRISVRTNSAVDLSQLKTFAVSAQTSISSTVAATIPVDVRANLDFVNRVVADVLVAKGLTQVTLDQNPDTVVVSLAWTQGQTGVTYTCVPGSWYSYWFYSWSPCAWLMPNAIDYTTGSLVIAMAVPATMQVAFGGLIQGVDTTQSLSSLMTNITEDIQTMFMSYPQLPTATTK